MLNWIKEKLRKVKEFFTGMLTKIAYKVSTKLSKAEEACKSSLGKRILRFANKAICTVFGGAVLFVECLSEKVTIGLLLIFAVISLELALLFTIVLFVRCLFDGFKESELLCESFKAAEMLENVLSF